jgi:sugar phosphate permease
LCLIFRQNLANNVLHSHSGPCLIAFRMSPNKEISPAHSWLVVALLWITFLLNYIDRQAVFSLYPSLQKDLGFTSAQLGLIGSVFLWVYSLSSVLTGRLADRFPKRALVVACLIIWSLATIGTCLSGSVHVFLYFRGLMGVSESMYLPASVALIATLHTGSARSTALALHQTAQMIGIILGGWGGAWMAEQLGWRNAFAILAIAGLAYAPLLWIGLRKLPATGPETVERVPWSRIFASRCYLGLVVAFTAYCLVLWILYAWFAVHLYERFHLSQAQSGLAATLYLQISTAVGVVFWGLAADRLVKFTKSARFLVVGVGIFASVPFAWLALSLGSLVGVKAASVGFGLFAGGLHSNIAAASLDVVPSRNYGVAVGVLNLVGGLGGGLAILLTGIYRGSLGIGTLMGYCCAAAILASCGMLLLVRIYLPREFRSEPVPVGRF